MNIITTKWTYIPPKYEVYSDKYRIFFYYTLEQKTVDVFYPNDVEKQELTKEYTEYTVYAIEIDNETMRKNLYKDSSELNFSKVILKEQIKAYDQFTTVNSFTINGEELWLDKATRVGLVNSINSEKSAGKETTTLWFNNKSITLNCDTALQMLNSLELYAIACYNKTAEHLANVEALTTVEEVEAYDYKIGYPDKLIFTI